MPVNCLITPIFIIRRGNIILSLRTRGLAITFLSAGFNSVLKENSVLFWHSVDPEIYFPIRIENMEISCIQIVDPGESLPFPSPYRSLSYNLGI